jgi:ElaB/YqjD/DUF883 family membrane-anchored ribosome-binding protein
VTATTTDPSPLKYMGTQSQETVNMAAALARAVESPEGRADQAMGKLADEVDDASSKVGDAANWALGKAKATLESAADQVRQRATKAVASYTREDPIRAILIAAGVGAVLMGVLAGMTRSGARAVERRVRR